jgi:hypothetical protein
LVGVALNDETCEAGVHLQSVDGESSLAQRAVDRRDEPVDRLRRQAEEVEVAGLPLHLAAGDEGSAAGECESLRLFQAGDNLRDPLLERAQRLRMAPQPVHPGSPDLGWQYKLIEELTQLVGLDVETHVVLGALAQDLLIDAGPIATVGEVVRDGRPAPADMERQLDLPLRLREGGVV